MIALTNADRALRPAQALTEYGDEAYEANLTDFLADAMHVCERSGDDFERCLRLARQHYAAEVNADE